MMKNVAQGSKVLSRRRADCRICDPLKNLQQFWSLHHLAPAEMQADTFSPTLPWDGVRRAAPLMTYPEQYRTQLLAAIQDIDLESVSAAIEMFRETRAHGRCIFVCGTGSGGAAAANLLCDAVRTISITSRDIEKLLPLSDVAIMVPSPDSVSAEDAQIIVCRMIANYFATVDTIHSARAS